MCITIRRTKSGETFTCPFLPEITVKKVNPPLLKTSYSLKKGTRTNFTELYIDAHPKCVAVLYALIPVQINHHLRGHVFMFWINWIGVIIILAFLRNAITI